jgi:pilus assembly protein CpaF
MNDDVVLRLERLERQLAALTSAPIVAPNNDEAREIELGRQLADAVHALAPLKSLLEDDSVNDILINGASNVFVERAGKLERTSITFASDEKVFAIAEAVAEHIGRQVSVRRPLLDARLPDGSRVNVVARPLAVDGTCISIRKFAKRSITLDDMAANENTSFGISEFLKVAARCRLNIIISGGTGSGKTTLLNAISQYIDPSERVVTIEDAAELRLQQPHVVRLETRPMRTDRFEDEISIRDLMRNALRMRPDRILVGEVRGAEAFDMMQAMNTGHEGSLTTIHANHPRDALARIENMMAMANLNLTLPAIRMQIASAVNLVVQISRMRDGHRRITYLSEVVGSESDVISMHDLFAFQHKGEEPSGRLIGEFKWTGIMPRFMRRVAYYGETDRLSEALGVRLPKL